MYAAGRTRKARKSKITYKHAGVDIDKADVFIERITPLIKKIDTKGVLGGIGGFSGFFQIDKAAYKKPVLVASSDGVGTKLLLTQGLGKYDTVGIDLVAMCVNDCIVTGARPLFFLDYFAVRRLDLVMAQEIMRGIVEGCRQAGCALLGGETAELPGLYRKGDYDLAGFCVGIVEKDNIIDGRAVRPGDAVLGVQSSGLHSNGFSLVRKIFSKRELCGIVGTLALTPTIIYVKPVLELLKSVGIKAMAHITGGGFYGNIPRVIPRNTDVVIERKAWQEPAIFTLIKENSRLSVKEMFTTFNMGIGLVIIMDTADYLRAQRVLRFFKLRSYAIGTVTKGNGEVIVN
jgi:phosphoribosylformylglycinamidine cyclo-ligase